MESSLAVNTAVNIVVLCTIVFAAGLFVQKVNALTAEVTKLRRHYHWLTQTLTVYLMKQGIVPPPKLDDAGEPTVPE